MLRPRVHSWCRALPLLMLAGLACSQSLNGHVVRVVDGDTLELRTSTQTMKTMKVRLAFIDAPERGQAYSQRAKEALAHWCAGQEAQVQQIDTDRYGRVVGEVHCRQANVNSALVHDGLAWVYRKYTPVGHSLYLEEATARTQHLGLWKEDTPVPPWEWRHLQRSRP